MFTNVIRNEGDQPRPGTNILGAAFLHKDLKSAKRHWWLDCQFALLGFAHVNAAHKHVG